MQHSIGIPRNQLRLKSLDDSTSLDNPLRFIDAFVEQVSLDFVWFKVQTIKNEGKNHVKTKTSMVGFEIDFAIAFGLIGRIVAKRKSRIQKKQ